MNPFISYAQNYEDIMLWRALKHIPQGFYVDVGAYDPIIASVTQAFYERGWHGINIEPLPSGYENLSRERTRDINLPIAIGSSEGQLTLFELPETGDSSVVKGLAQKYYLEGRTIVEHTVRVSTLNQVLEENNCGEIHFLKIDVEGYEKAVLEGLSLTKWRPWILVMEATLPNSPIINDEFPGATIVSSGYTFVYFDGLNRFYIANEHPELRDAFAVPPNYFDNFITSYQLNLINNIAWQESVIQGLNEKQKHLEFNKKELDALRPELDWARGELPYLRTEIARMREEGKQLQALVKEGETARVEAAELRGGLEVLRVQNENSRMEVENLRSQINNLQAEADKLLRSGEEGLRPQINFLQAELKASQAETEYLRHQYVNILYSQSYRITAPLRSLYRLVSKLRRGGRYLAPSQAGAAAPIPDTETGVSQIKREQQVDENYFLNLFQNEIDTRKK